MNVSQWDSSRNISKFANKKIHKDKREKGSNGD